MKLSDLLAGHDHEILRGDPETAITAGLCFDAHRVSPGSLFIAVPGHRGGGPESVGPALARGAVAVLVDAATAELPLAARSRARPSASYAFRTPVPPRRSSPPATTVTPASRWT